MLWRRTFVAQDGVNAAFDHLLCSPLPIVYPTALCVCVVQDERPHVNCVVSLFLLSQVFLIMHHAPLVRQLADIIFHADKSVFTEEDTGPLAKAPVSQPVELERKYVVGKMSTMSW